MRSGVRAALEQRRDPSWALRRARSQSAALWRIGKLTARSLKRWSDEVRASFATPGSRTPPSTTRPRGSAVRRLDGPGDVGHERARYPQWARGASAGGHSLRTSGSCKRREALPGSVPRGLDCPLAGRASSCPSFSIDPAQCVRRALAHQISIDGHSGTGKTQTILNLIASLIAPEQTIGVVAGANSAVDNVIDKLTWWPSLGKSGGVRNSRA